MPSQHMGNFTHSLQSECRDSSLPGRCGRLAPSGWEKSRVGGQRGVPWLCCWTTRLPWSPVLIHDGDAGPGLRTGPSKADDGPADSSSPAPCLGRKSRVFPPGQRDCGTGCDPGDREPREGGPWPLWAPAFPGRAPLGRENFQKLVSALAPRGFLPLPGMLTGRPTGQPSEPSDPSAQAFISSRSFKPAGSSAGHHGARVPELGPHGMDPFSADGRWRGGSRSPEAWPRPSDLPCCDCFVRLLVSKAPSGAGGQEEAQTPEGSGFLLPALQHARATCRHGPAGLRGRAESARRTRSEPTAVRGSRRSRFSRGTSVDVARCFCVLGISLGRAELVPSPHTCSLPLLQGGCSHLWEKDWDSWGWLPGSRGAVPGVGTGSRPGARFSEVDAADPCWGLTGNPSLVPDKEGGNTWLQVQHGAWRVVKRGSDWSKVTQLTHSHELRMKNQRSCTEPPKEAPSIGPGALGCESPVCTPAAPAMVPGDLTSTAAAEHVQLPPGQGVVHRGAGKMASHEQTCVGFLAHVCLWGLQGRPR
ncbi:hypothetical protein Cadr_000013127 [Camelus dromedarius]|uniref:Uncharacterized protein n=1 Tax=Camelus dromedarius TaxID=9838 RepID=A0A5N4DBI9_CAMDR|nr:hypothetical protein Cadr_000013127 [Camelus dromedarius]